MAADLPTQQSPASRLWPKLVLTGLLTGFVSVTFGIGGGVLTVPLLMWLCKIPAKHAIATSLVTVVGVAASGAAIEIATHPEHILWDFAFMLAGTSLLGVVAGRAVFKRAPEAALLIFFALLLLAVATKFMGWLEVGSGDHATFYEYLLGATGSADGGTAALGVRLALCIALGVIAGFTSVLFGIGGGVIYVPGLLLLFGAFSLVGADGAAVYPARATSLVAVVITSAYGGWLHWRDGNVVMPAVKILTPFGIIGAIAGVFIAQVIDAATFKLLFAGILALQAAQMLTTALRAKRQ